MRLFLWFATEEASQTKSNGSQGEVREFSPSLPGQNTRWRLLGLLGLEDPIREDSKALVQNLKSLGVRVIMVTGDGPATARAVSLQVGIGDRVGSAESLRNGAGLATEQYDVFAGVFPEDKFRLVQALQRQGHVVGMTGDGVNDAPALKQAEAGIAVSTATDVAKAAASIVLTESGLIGRAPRRRNRPQNLPAHADVHAQQNHQDDRNRASSSALA